MNIELKLVGDLNELAPVLNILTGQTVNTVAKGPAKTAAQKPAAAVEVAAEDEDEKPAPKAAAKAPAPKPGAAKAPAAKAPAKKPAAAEEAVAFDDMEEEDQLAELVRFATSFTKKGRTAEIKQLVSLFDAPKASSLDPAVYGEFYGLLERLKDGETAEDIVDSYAV